MPKKNKEREGSVVLDVAAPRIVSRRMPVFYNPAMRLNRDLAVLFLKAWDRDNLRIADVLAGTGVRALRFLKELPARKIRSILVNDANPSAVKRIKKHAKMNKAGLRKMRVHNHDASICLLQETAQDYIDIDPFGSPNPFLDASVKRLRRKGVLAVTATDTAALAGTTPIACRRKYWAAPLRNACMHETGLRILVRKVQLIAAQYGKALVPVFVHATAHYVRAYLEHVPGEGKLRDVLRQHGFLLHCPQCTSHRPSRLPEGTCCKKEMQSAGPLWLGHLWDALLVKRMQDAAQGEARALLDVIAQEARVNVQCFFDVHALCRKLRIPAVSRHAVRAALRRKGIPAAETHFSAHGIRTAAPAKELIGILSLAARQARSRQG